ncbi:hypothetical protein PAMA_002378 [Pampus argenteus]
MVSPTHCLPPLSDDIFHNIVSLAGLKMFTELEELVVDNNLLGNDLQLPRLPNLHTLTLNKNQISFQTNHSPFLILISSILRAYSRLQHRINCFFLVSPDKDEDDYQRYRYFVLHKLPQLKFLDTRKVTKKEVMEAQARGAFMKVVKPKSEAHSLVATSVVCAYTSLLCGFQSLSDIRVIEISGDVKHINITSLEFELCGKMSVTIGIQMHANRFAMLHPGIGLTLMHCPILKKRYQSQ